MRENRKNTEIISAHGDNYTLPFLLIKINFIIMNISVRSSGVSIKVLLVVGLPDSYWINLFLFLQII